MARTKTSESTSASTSDAPSDGPARTAFGRGAESYTVVARRYRPQRFEEVIGQDHVVRALRNAIRMDRVAQAYLFSGTRGVGKTSIARIFAKALNCERGGPTETPCNECDTCQAIASGQDVDVIEIDGASNNGVEAVRELRQNAGLRPSRSHYKIYYIDEVHMLSTSAFNALLKTLEEPPSHVKFVFATTEPNKIPITVLSRCQRFDFAGIGPDQIVDQLVSICKQEGVPAEREALHVVARRASGSMRDAQSLLEQLLSSGTEELTADRVHQLLGIAGDERVLELLDALANRDPAGALLILDQAVNDGVQPTDVLNSAIEFLRDVMMVAAGANVPPLAAMPAQRDRLSSLAGRWTLDTILAAQQILAETRGRLRGSPHTRLLVELALCRISRLEDLADLSELIALLGKGEAGAAPPGPIGVKKKPTEPVKLAPPPEKPSHAPRPDAIPSSPRLPDGSDNGHRAESARVEAPEVEPVPESTLDEAEEARPSPAPARNGESSGSPLDRIRAAWQNLGERTAELKLPAHMKRLEPESVSESGIVLVPVPSALTYLADRCEAPELRSKIEGSLAEALGRGVSVQFERATPDAVPVSAVAEPGSSAHQAVLDDDLVRHLVTRFEAQLRRVEAATEDLSGTSSEADSEPDLDSED